MLLVYVSDNASPKAVTLSESPSLMYHSKGRNGQGDFWKGMLVLIPPVVRVVFREGSRRTVEFDCKNKALERWIDTGIKKKKNLMLPFHIAEWGSCRRSRVLSCDVRRLRVRCRLHFCGFF